MKRWLRTTDEEASLMRPKSRPPSVPRKPRITRTPRKPSVPRKSRITRAPSTPRNPR